MLSDRRTVRSGFHPKIRRGCWLSERGSRRTWRGRWLRRRVRARSGKRRRRDKSSHAERYDRNSKNAAAHGDSLLLIGGAVRRSDRFRIVENRPSRLNGSLNTSCYFSPSTRPISIRSNRFSPSSNTCCARRRHETSRPSSPPPANSSARLHAARVRQLLCQRRLRASLNSSRSSLPAAAMRVGAGVSCPAFSFIGDNVTSLLRSTNRHIRRRRAAAGPEGKPPGGPLSRNAAGPALFRGRRRSKRPPASRLEEVVGQFE